MNLSNEFREQVRTAIINGCDQHPDWNDSQYAKSLKINRSVFSRLKGGEIERVLSDGEWIRLGMRFNVNQFNNDWKTVRTSIYNEMEDNINFCKKYSRSMMVADLCGIGKTHCAKHIVGGLSNAFYVDCSQCKGKYEFMRTIARTIGVDELGKYSDVKARIKYAINQIQTPLFVLDDVGYLSAPAWLDIIELQNATVGTCGFYLLGDDSLQNKIERGIGRKKLGYRAFHSRFGEEYVSFVPNGENKQAFMRQLIADVAQANLKNKTKLNAIVKACLSEDKSLRKVDVMVKLNNDEYGATA